jgi:hypothetical protein
MIPHIPEELSTGIDWSPPRDHGQHDAAPRS